MFSESDLSALLITLKLAAITTIILLIIGTPLAWWLARSRWRFKFLIEAIVICMIVGVVGTALGITMGNVIARVFKSETFVAPWEWVILGFSVCLVVGLISGFYPAYKASKLDPIESLHYE